MTLVKEVKLICADISNNNNKYWYGWAYDDGTFEYQHGRVGKDAAIHSKSLGSSDEAVRYLESKQRSKMKVRAGKPPYKELNVVGDGQTAEIVNKSGLQKIAKDQIKSKNKKSQTVVTKLVDYFIKVNAHDIHTATGGKITLNNDTGLFQTPLGIVTQDAIDEANDLLIKIGDYVERGTYGKRMEGHVNNYMMLIPQDIGMKRIDIGEFFANLTSVQKQKSILDSLQVSLDTALTDPDAPEDAEDTLESVFNVEVDLVSAKATIDRIKRKYSKTRKRQHSCNHLDVNKVYTIQIVSERENFDKVGKSVGNVKELWHGTRASNVLSILRGGLIIPPSSASNVTGRMYGDGLYFSDQSTKSLNYAYGYWGGGNRDNNCFMFLADVAMGKDYTPTTSYRSFPVKGYDSTFAKAGKSGVMNNEMIVYNTNQVSLKYLIEFT
jgi:poly [ADP-ribose] polymerase